MLAFVIGIDHRSTVGDRLDRAHGDVDGTIEAERLERAVVGDVPAAALVDDPCPCRDIGPCREIGLGDGERDVDEPALPR